MITCVHFMWKMKRIFQFFGKERPGIETEVQTIIEMTFANKNTTLADEIATLTKYSGHLDFNSVFISIFAKQILSISFICKLRLAY